MTFSFIIPTYNEEKYIVQCLKSLRAQVMSGDTYEIIVSDACSNDKTCILAREYANKIIQTNERGISIGRNRGAFAAKGDILIFIDADAIVRNDFLKQCEITFKDEDIVCMTGIAIPKDGSLIQRIVYKGTYLLVKFFKIFNLALFPGICVAYRKSTFLKAGGFREDFGVVEDLDLSKRISKYGRCVINKDAVAYVSTRRLEKKLLSTVLFHIFCDIRYLVTGKAPKVYLKTEEVKSSADLWKHI